MTTAELRVLKTRMDMLDAMLQELIDQVRLMQPSGSTGSPQPKVSALSVGRVVQGLLQVIAHGFEDRAAHKFIGLREIHPAHFGQLLVVADEGISAMSWPGCHVDHGAASLGVDTAADDTAGPDPQACFLFDFSYRGVGRAFPRLDLSCDERPGRLAVVAPGHQDAEVACDDGRDDGSRFGQR